MENIMFIKVSNKQADKLYKALRMLLHNSVDKIGVPKRATVKQLLSAKKVLTEYENYLKTIDIS